LFSTLINAGGAQDIENFRENIKDGFLPLPSDVTFGGVAKDYYFDTTSPNNSQTCAELFCPVYSAASTADPLIVAAYDGSNTSDIYLAVGLDSGMQAADVVRHPLNLALVLDVSGSMDSGCVR
jgi:Ca-activated chloride channel family protein